MDGCLVLDLDPIGACPNAPQLVPHGNYDTLLQTRNFSSIEPDVVEEKFYAPGVGVVLEITVSGGTDRGELISFEQGS